MTVLYFAHMRIERLYLGTWTQRTNLHLQEVYRFLVQGSGVVGLEPSKTAELRSALGVESVIFRESLINTVSVTCGGRPVTFTEDGLVIISSKANDIKTGYDALSAFRTGSLEPALNHLFSRGAPLPKQRVDIDPEEVLLVVVRGATDEEVSATFASFGDVPHSHSSAEGIRVMTGEKFELIDLGEAAVSEADMDGFVRDLVFFREFDRQLHAYLREHRRIWDKVSAIRDARSMKYADFPAVRTEIMSFEKTLGIVRARLAQMDDILGARRAGEEKTVARILAGLGMFDFNSLHASRRYVSHLWDMTDDYADGTLGMLEAL